MKQLYGTAEVKEITLTQQELARMAIENIANRTEERYNFDFTRPVVIWAESGELVIRFLTKEMTSETSARDVRLKSFEELRAQAKK